MLIKCMESSRFHESALRFKNSLRVTVSTLSPFFSQSLLSFFHPFSPFFHSKRFNFWLRSWGFGSLSQSLGHCFKKYTSKWEDRLYIFDTDNIQKVRRNALEDNQSGESMALVLELVSITIFLATKSLLLAKQSGLFGIRSICLVIQTWIELLRAAICFLLKVLWTMIIWTIAILSLPVRALNALQREKMLEMHILEMQTEWENIISHRKKLEERLQRAVRERGLLEELLAEHEDEHDEAICKLEQLEGELRDLKAETFQLKEVQSKASRCSRCQQECNMGNGGTFQGTNKFEISLLKSSYRGSNVKGPDVRCKSKFELNDVKKEAFNSKGSIQLFPHDVVEERRDIALSRSIFSTTLSLFIGIIMWEAEDPCMPLLFALFCVVGISLASVLRFFFTIQNKPAIEAVALLSLNWFLLGTLMYPALPTLANVLASFTHHAAKEMVK